MLTEPFPDPGRRAPHANREPDREYDHRLLRLLEEHGAAEGVLLARYQQVADRAATDPAMRFLVDLILADERRHHEVFEQMANAIRSFVMEMPIEPSLREAARHHDPELHEATGDLLHAEHQDRKELKALRSTLRNRRASKFDALMVELMLHDTAKHIAILEYLHERCSR